MKSIVNIFQEITSHEPETYAKISIKSVTQNSFEIDMGAVISYVPTLFTKDNIGYARLIVETLFECFKLKRFLNGKKPKSVEKDGVVENYNGNRQSFGNASTIYFQNCTIDRSFNGLFQALDKDSDRTALEVKAPDLKKEKIIISKEEYPLMALPVVTDDPKTQIIHIKESEEEVSLFVKKIDLLGDSKWDFIFNKPIKAKILDQDWLDRFRKRTVSILPGDTLRVKIKSRIEFDDSNNILDEKYDILKVLNVIEPSKNESLFDT